MLTTTQPFSSSLSIAKPCNLCCGGNRHHHHFVVNNDYVIITDGHTRADSELCCRVCCMCADEIMRMSRLSRWRILLPSTRVPCWIGLESLSQTKNRFPLRATRENRRRRPQEQPYSVFISIRCHHFDYITRHTSEITAEWEEYVRMYMCIAKSQDDDVDPFIHLLWDSVVWCGWTFTLYLPFNASLLCVSESGWFIPGGRKGGSNRDS